VRVQKALGRCNRRHVAVVEYEDGTMPAGVCKDKTCGEPLIEWAVKNPPSQKES
jgi:hypothetical protein